ncbi:MAG: hypothetical protein JXB46_03415, partial [Candidatus Eisenbacteria bacterium]|nr:hypothetical protein [Candidatus Eisenbacteria bacterium]
MPKTILRRAFLSLAAVAIALAALAVVLLYTPIGVRLGINIVWPLLAGDSGISLTVGSVEGGLLRGASLSGTRVTSSDGTTIFFADSVSARLGSFDPGARSVAVTDAR